MQSIKKIFYFSIFALSLPLKLIGDIANYLFAFGIPSATTVALPLAVLTFTIWNPKWPEDKRVNILIVYGFFLIFLFTIISMIAFSKHTRGLNIIVINSISTSIGMYFIYLIAGIGFTKSITTTYFLFLVTTTVSAIVLWTQFMIKDVWMQLNEYGAYLRIADLYAFILLLILPKINHGLVRIIFIFIAMNVLIIIGSRSSLFFFTASAVIDWIYKFNLISIKNLTKKIPLAISICTILFAVTIYPVDSIFASNLSETRLLQSIKEDGNSGVEDRTQLLQAGLQRIENSPLVGNWLLRISHSSTGGDYIHNILFLWDDYGLLIFSISIVIIFSTYLKVLKHPDLHDYFGALIFCTLSLFFARAYAFPYLFFIVGSVFFRKYSYKDRSPQLRL